MPAPDASDWESGPPDAAVVLIVYADFECPYCGALEARLVRAVEHGVPGGLRRVFRHFPVKSAHPRAFAAACAAEAAGTQGRFWEMHDALFADQARLEDPHLWRRAEQLGLDLERFDADRRGDAVRARIDGHFRTGVRAGVATTPTVFQWRTEQAIRLPEDALVQLLAAGE